jgi:hypothetical protein
VGASGIAHWEEEDKPAGVAPLGYRYEGKTLVVDHAEADVVKAVFRVYLDTESIAQVQAHLKATPAPRPANA